MKCPKCNETLVMADRNGVEIDYCPNCRGVWLDRGELDKILERTGDYYSDKENYREDYRKDDGFKYYDKHRHPQHPYKKKKSFFSDFFDFD
ncbi:MAG TPA: zf-TFIIB domain-containing protein [Chitinophagaceae bacterium]|nr:zf-TFIIB domain-containing protein [Chitinophagaceae bacterium]